MCHWILREKEVKSLFKEIMAESFQNLGKDLDIQVHEVNTSPKDYNKNCFLQDTL